MSKSSLNIGNGLKIRIYSVSYGTIKWAIKQQFTNLMRMRLWVRVKDVNDIFIQLCESSFSPISTSALLWNGFNMMNSAQLDDSTRSINVPGQFDKLNVLTALAIFPEAVGDGVWALENIPEYQKI